MADVVTFNGETLRIVEISTGDDNELDALEVYSEWKDWLLADLSRLKYPKAFLPIGGQPRSASQLLGITYFLGTGWRIRPAEHSHKLTVVGNIFSETAGASVFTPTLGTYTVHTETVVSNWVDLLSADAAVEQASIRAAMTAQGYTDTRAPYLDYLDAAVSSRAAPGAAMALTAGERLAVAQAVLAGSLPSGETVEDTLDLVRKVHTNRLDAAPGDPGTLILYDDDAATPIKTWPLRDYAGSAVVGAVGSPALRGEAT